MVYSKDGELTCSKATFAQCSHVLQHKTTLDQILKSVPSIQARNQGLLYVLLYELLMGPNKSIRGGGAVKRVLTKNRDIFEKKLQQLHDLDQDATQQVTQPESSTAIPRYVRINTLVASRDATLEELRSKIGSMYVDPHVPDLMVVEPTAKIRSLLQEFVTSHKVVLQDKSSCFSALCLVHGFEEMNVSGDVLDACAAPGNKTSHLAALVHNQSLSSSTDGSLPSIFALDKSPDRYRVLKRRMHELVVPESLVQCHNLDFLQAFPTKAALSNRKHQQNCNGRVMDEFHKVSAILLDPSCSGSGMTANHTEYSLNRDPYFSDDRIKSLSDFQFQALRHATTDFPHVDRLVYSTCSRYYQENEAVVHRILNETNGEWELVSPRCLQNWPRRGLPVRVNCGSKEDVAIGLSEDQAKCCIRVDPDRDATNGFFVACLQRVKSINKRKTSPLSWKSTEKALPKGMELYNNQFNRENQLPATSERTQTIKKRKADFDDSTYKGRIEASSTISKKRSKKLEWKRQQRSKKEIRLKQKKGGMADK